MKIWQAVLTTILVCLVVGGNGRVRADEPPPLVESYLNQGQYAVGDKVLTEALQKEPKNDQIRFGLGVLRFFRTIEHFGQSMHKYGLRNDRNTFVGAQIPFLRFPVPFNPKPEPFTYENARQVLQDMIDDLKRSESILSEIQTDQVKLSIHLDQVTLDLDGDGESKERLFAILNRYFGGNRNTNALGVNPEQLHIHFDRGDVDWLRGYCHLLSGLCEVLLAHDTHELFEVVGPAFFPKVKTPHAFMGNGAPGELVFNVGDDLDIMDLIAGIHLMRFPIHEPNRMKAALEHFEAMLALSKESWSRILAETDNDHEWLPNPNQISAFGIPVRKDQIAAWMSMVEEMQRLFAGTKLVPFWRKSPPGTGVNLRKVFLEPKGFDLVLWVQGAQATPYLEKGELSTRTVWDQLTRTFGGQFAGFAFWFN